MTFYSNRIRTYDCYLELQKCKFVFTIPIGKFNEDHPSGKASGCTAPHIKHRKFFLLLDPHKLRTALSLICIRV